MAKLYRIKSRYLTKPALITHVDGQVVNLIPATNQIPAKTVEIPGATQAQLKIAFEAGNETIEVVDVPDDKATKATV